LVEAKNNRFSSLFTAVILAANLVAANGGGEVSMSFGSGEFSIEKQFDGIFTTPGVVYIASSGDSTVTGWPSASPNVVSAGGTTLSRDPNTGEFLLENTWQDAGGGPSLYETRPHFQDRIAEIVGNSRGTPDFSFDANPATGVWVLDTNLFQGGPGGWFPGVGGTSVSAPSLAGIINAAGKFASSSQDENALIYRHIFSDRDDFHHVRYGTCGIYMGFTMERWDFCTGVGSDIGLGGK
jgi:subtilase family serine protease